MHLVDGMKAWLLATKLNYIRAEPSFDATKLPAHVDFMLEIACGAIPFVVLRIYHLHFVEESGIAESLDFLFDTLKLSGLPGLVKEKVKNLNSRKQSYAAKAGCATSMDV